MESTENLPVSRVIVGINGSPGSLAALRCAWQEARRCNVELHVVCAFRGGQPQYGPASIGAPDLFGEQRRTARRTLAHALLDGLGFPAEGSPLTGVVALGRPADVLTDYADRPDDLLVVGAGSAGPLRRLLTASVASACLRRARCPVLAVPQPELGREYRRGLRRWNGWVHRQAEEAASAALHDHVAHT